ncbi:MAG TPA: carboxypeptidase-like regulatory domain-containing protein [Vicinamibacterales bacterium]|nr:carboxypeptidase-like regulatory domain-containing protein [Vicinamibacterales bacterium]
MAIVTSCFRAAIGVAAMIVLLPALAGAQGAIQGTLTDESHSPLSGALVRVTRGSESIRTVVTTATGAFEIGALRPGTYSVSFELPGFRIASRDAVTVGSEAVRIDAVATVERCPGIRPGEQCVQNSLVERPIEWADVPCESVALTQHGGLVFSPEYAHVLEYRRGGRATLSVETEFGQRITYEASIDMAEFARLCSLIDHFGFEQMKPGYVASGYDNAGFEVNVNRAGTEKRVRDEGFVGPLELFAIRDSIEAIRATLTWKPQ